jgi:hypothetical protein
MSESTMFNLASIIQESAVDIEGKTVVLELHCRGQWIFPEASWRARCLINWPHMNASIADLLYRAASADA